MSDRAKEPVFPSSQKLGNSSRKGYVELLQTQEESGWSFIDDFGYTTEAFKPRRYTIQQTPLKADVEGSESGTQGPTPVEDSRTIKKELSELTFQREPLANQTAVSRFTLG